MGAKRYKDQILSHILQTCQGDGASKTKIVYASGLNFKTIKPYLATLDKNGLIELMPGSHPLYRITQKGKDALVHLKALEKLDCTPDSRQLVKQQYLRQSPFRTVLEIYSPKLNVTSYGCTPSQ